MHLRTIGSALIAVTAITTPLHAQNRLESDTSLASMVAVERAFARHSSRVGTQSAFLSYLAPDAIIYRPGAVMAHTYLRARPMPPDLTLIWEPVFADISAAGDMGYTTGPWISASRSRTDVDPTFGEYVTIWRRQGDGTWKAELDAGIAHGPDPVGPAALTAAPEPGRRGRSPEAALASLLAADSALAAAAAKSGAAAAFPRAAAAHMRLLRPNRFPLTADSATAFLRATAGYTWKAAKGAVSTSGDFGYTFGPYAITTKPGAREALENGDFLRIWRRNSAGEWKVALDLTSPTG